MKSVSHIALGLALAVGLTAGASTPAWAAKKEKPAEAPAGYAPKDLSKEFRAPVADAQKAIAAKDYATAQAKLAEAAPLAKTPDEKWTLGTLKLQIGQATQNTALQREALDDLVASGTGPADMKPKYLYYQGSLAYNAGDYAKAIAALNAAEQAGYVDKDANGQPTENTELMLAEAYFKTNQNQQGLAQVEKAVQAAKAAGQKPPIEWYRRAASVAYQAKMAPDVMKWTRMELVDYPTPENWRNALIIYGDSAHLEDQAELDRLRLQRAAGALTGERDYYEYAMLADKLGLPGEAKAVVDEGLAKKAFDSNSKAVNDIAAKEAPRIAEDKASLAKSEKSAATAANGKVAQGTADAYIGYGNYAKAAELYRLALQKGGVDANLVNTRLGIALALSGQKDAAKQAFQAVTGPRKELADFWMLWLDQRPA